MKNIQEMSIDQKLSIFEGLDKNRKFIEEKLEKSALTIECSKWQYTFYQPKEFLDFHKELKESIESLERV